MIAANYIPFDFMLDAAAPEYKFFKLELTAEGNFQLSEINLIFDGAVTEDEEPAAEEVPVIEEVVEAPAEEEVPVVEEAIETPAAEEPSVIEAPQTFDFALFAAVTAIVSAAGCLISKKK